MFLDLGKLLCPCISGSSQRHRLAQIAWPAISHVLYDGKTATHDVGRMNQGMMFRGNKWGQNPVNVVAYNYRSL